MATSSRVLSFFKFRRHSGDTDNTNQDTREVFEFTPFIQDGDNVVDDEHVQEGEEQQSASLITRDIQNGANHKRRKWRVILMLYAFSFCMMLGDNMYPAALIQLMEDILCNEYYSTQSGSDAFNAQDLSDRCKAQPVQRELALVRGFHMLVPVFAGVMCTIPYGLLADRIGRKRVLVLSGVGMASAFAWVLAVCYFRFLPIRWVWLSGAFLFIGGGEPVMSSVSYVMISDITERSERAQIFLFLHAADVVSGFFGPGISAALMENGYIWSVLLLCLAIYFFGAFVIAPLIPETLHLSPIMSPRRPSDASSLQDMDCEMLDFGEASKSNAGLLAPLRIVLTSNSQAVLLLCIYGPQTAARELFNSVGLQYSNAKFDLSYARGNVLLSLYEGAQGLMALVLLPFITRVVAEPRGWTAWARDRLYAISSIGAMAAGLLVIGLAPLLSVEVVGLVVVSLGSCTNALLVSLMGGAVRSEQVSAVYSAALMLNILLRSLTAPIFNGLLVVGMELGWKWLGLPFAVMAALMACQLVASFFIVAEKTGRIDGE